MAKRVLIFSTAYLPLIGGAELAVKELTDRLSDFEFDLITAKLKPELKSVEQIGRVKVYRLGLGIKILDKLLLPFLGSIKTWQLDRKNNYLAFWGIMATFASGAAYIHNIIRFWSSVPIVLNLQEGDSEAHLKFRWFGLIGLSWWLALKFTTHLTVISNYLAIRARAYGYRGPVTVLPNGVDLKTFHCDQEKLNDNEEKIIFTSSRLVKKNAVDVIVNSLSQLSNNFKLRIAGVGEEEKVLKTLVKDLGVGERVIFLGNLTPAQVAQELQQASIFTRPSRSEGLGNSFLEAFASGVPVIATPVGGIPDFLKDNETGFLVPVDNADALAEKIKFIANPQNKEQVWSITNAARDLVRQTYSWDTLAPQMAQILNQL